MVDRRVQWNRLVSDEKWDVTHQELMKDKKRVDEENRKKVQQQSFPPKEPKKDK